MTGFIPPKTIDEVAIHLGNLFEVQKRIEDKIDGIGTRFPTQEEFNVVKVEVKEHETKIQSFTGYKMWLMGAVAVILASQGIIMYSAKSYITSVVNDVLAENYNVTYETNTQTTAQR